MVGSCTEAGVRESSDLTVLMLWSAAASSSMLVAVGDVESVDMMAGWDGGGIDGADGGADGGMGDQTNLGGTSSRLPTRSTTKSPVFSIPSLGLLSVFQFSRRLSQKHQY